MTVPSSDKSDDEIMQELARAAQEFCRRFGEDELIQALQSLIDTLHARPG